MKIVGERNILATQPVTWDALNDPDILRTCIPGCDEMQRVSGSEYRLSMLAVVGPVKARFTGTLRLSDIVVPERYQLSFEGSGGAAGFGKGSATVTLSSVDSTATLLTYTAEAQVGGKIAQVGSRLIDGIARKIADEFFARFEAQLTARQAEPTRAPEVDLRPGTEPKVKGAGRIPTGRPLLWSAALAAVIVGVIVAFALQHSA
jgi:carbon monoxide dehydrogenase subunit G